MAKLPGGVRKPQKPDAPILARVIEVMPKDKPFTLADVVALLRASEPGREFKTESVRSYLCRLHKRGQVTRLHKTHHNQTLWAPADAPDNPFAQTPLADMAEQLIRERGPMSTTELVLAAQEIGYRTDVSPYTLRRSFRDAFRAAYLRFERDGKGKWEISR
jgi:hypothetical protein